MMDSLIPIRVLIVAEDPLARAGLVGLVTMADHCEIVGQVAEGHDLAGLIDIYQPDVILWDVGWDVTEEAVTTLRDGVNGLPAPEEGGTPVLVLTAEPEAASELWASGIHGMLPRDASAEQIGGAALAAAVGLVTFSAPLAEALLPQAPSDTAFTLLEDLTPRESEVLQLLAEGLANKAIARRLNISEHTVKFHVNAILTKLGANSRTQAVVRATRAGLIVL